MIELFDSHAHLNNEKFIDDLDEVILRAATNQVSFILNVGWDIESSKKAVELAEKYPNQYAAVGIHPHDAEDYGEMEERILEHLAANKKVVAIGETGLDYYRNLSPKEVQRDAFKRQIALAKRVKKPLIIHDRDAHQEVMEILKEEKASEVGIVLHCFSGSSQMALECIKMGWFISLAGPVTYPNAVKPVQVAEVVPIDKLFIETDCPYLGPQSVRGKRNEPANVKHVAEKIAQVRKKTIEEIAYHTTENAKKFFKIS
ncbi:MAG: hydrolase TatD [Desulfitibacter sp. BRH_c19]|nr:MAG: hydrolase TatD [Desulfitibacter sp. BRH_c19]